MTLYVQNGTTYRPVKEEDLVVTKSLPRGTFNVAFNTLGQTYYLEKIADFTLPPKLYGDTTRKAERIIQTYKNRPGSTGVLLTGEKGSGKTLLAKALSTTLRDTENIPTIVVSNNFVGPVFNNFIQSIREPALIIFDEFEKVYDKEDQEAVLTLFDGIFSSKKLFVLTVNTTYKLDDNLLNRPGRMYYRLNYRGLSEEFIEDYCHDKLNNKQWIKAITSLAGVFREFNFDMLQTLVEESNRYNEDPLECISMLNIEPIIRSNGEREYYKVSIKNIKTNKIYEVSSPDYLYAPPIMSNRTTYTAYERLDDADDGKQVTFECTSENIQTVDHKNGKYVYLVDDTYQITIVREERDVTSFDYRKLLSI